MSRQIISNNIEVALKGLFSDAMKAAFPSAAMPDPLVTPGKFSDFQCNNAMALAKQVKMPPKEVAKQLISSLPANDLVDKVDATDQGFITVNVASEWLATTMTRTMQQGVTAPHVKSERVLVDFSSPNIAKEMHVGHLRSTIIGESICRLLEFVGHDVKRINHVGDWGTQFGMLILYMKINFPDFLTVTPPISDLVMFYKAAKKKFDEDPEFKEAARNEVVKLQALEKDSIKAWQLICDLSRKEFQEIYDRLHIKLEERGESFYNPIIPEVLDKLEAAGEVEESDGAKIIVSKAHKKLADLDAKDLSKLLAYFITSKRDGTLDVNAALLQELKQTKILVSEETGDVFVMGKDKRPIAKFDTQKDMDKLAKASLTLFKGTPKESLATEMTRLGLLKDGVVAVPRYSFPLIVRKSDGGYTYDTTDIAAAYHRFVVEDLDRVIYVTDSGQYEHFRMVLQTAADMKWMAGAKRWAHAGFGLVSGEDGKKLKTRSGDTVKLKDLLDEACNRARNNLVAREEEQPQGFTPEEMTELGRKIGLGAIKYFDLKQNRTTDYSFSYDKMLDFNGNTAVYMLYSYARICSIKRKANAEIESIANTPIQLTTPKERKLALAVLKFEPTILKTVEDLFPHHIADFCYELVGAFSEFYNDCKVIGDPQQNSRLLLIEVVGTTLKKALELLGIEVANRL